MNTFVSHLTILPFVHSSSPSSFMPLGSFTSPLTWRSPLLSSILLETELWKPECRPARCPLLVLLFQKRISIIFSLFPGFSLSVFLILGLLCYLITLQNLISHVIQLHLIAFFIIPAFCPSFNSLYSPFCSLVSFFHSFFLIFLESSRTGWSPGCSLNTHLNPWTHTLIRKGMGSFSIIDHHAAWPCACICVSAWRGPHSGYVWGHAMEDNNRWSGNGGTPGNSSGHGREQPQECANKTNTFRSMNARTHAHSNTNQSAYSDSLVGFQREPFITWRFVYPVVQMYFSPKRFTS